MLATLAGFAGVVGLAFYAYYFVPGSDLFFPETMLLRLGGVTISSILAALIVRLLTRSRAPLSGSLTKLLLLALTLATVMLASFVYVNLRTPMIGWLHSPRHIALGLEELSLGETIVTFLISVAVAALIFLVGSFALVKLFDLASSGRRLK